MPAVIGTSFLAHCQVANLPLLETQGQDLVRRCKEKAMLGVPVSLTLWLCLLLTGDLELSESHSTQDPVVGGEAKLQQRVWSPGTAGQARVPTDATCLPAGAWPEPPAPTLSC